MEAVQQEAELTVKRVGSRGRLTAETKNVNDLSLLQVSWDHMGEEFLTWIIQVSVQVRCVSFQIFIPFLIDC